MILLYYVDEVTIKEKTEVHKSVTLKGIVKGKVIELESDVILPEGTEVEVVVREPGTEKLGISSDPKGSPKAILAIWDSAPHCTPEDVDFLVQEIEQGKRPAKFEGIFDQGEGIK